MPPLPQLRGAGLPLTVLLASPLWLLGGALIGLETVANIVALGLAAVALIQPLGTLSLVVAVLLTAASTRTRPSGAVLGAVLLVIDPLTAIAVGGLVLGEARPVSTAAALLLLVSAVGALWGVRVLVRHRPGTPAPASSPAQRGSADTMEGARAEGVPTPS